MSEIGDPEVKCWGTTQCIYCEPFMQIHYLEINPDSWCSRHRHKGKTNIFHLLEGEVHVRVYHLDGKPRRTYILSPSNPRTVIPSNTWHRFIGVEKSKVIEIYTSVQVWDGDIERADQGDIGNMNEKGVV